MSYQPCDKLTGVSVACSPVADLSQTLSEITSGMLIDLFLRRQLLNASCFISLIIWQQTERKRKGMRFHFSRGLKHWNALNDRGFVWSEGGGVAVKTPNLQCSRCNARGQCHSALPLIWGRFLRKTYDHYSVSQRNVWSLLQQENCSDDLKKMTSIKHKQWTMQLQWKMQN